MCAIGAEDVLVGEDGAGEGLTEVVFRSVVLDFDDVAPEAVIDDPAGRLEAFENLFFGCVTCEQARPLFLLG